MTRILIIDDEELVRATVRQMLELEGYEIEEAANGREGIERLKEKPADLVITDIIMPEKEGIETIIEIRRQNPRAKIIAISSGGRTGTTEYLELAVKLGAAHILPKPFDSKQLLQAVRATLTPS